MPSINLSEYWTTPDFVIEMLVISRFHCNIQIHAQQIPHRLRDRSYPFEEYDDKDFRSSFPLRKDPVTNQLNILGKDLSKFYKRRGLLLTPLLSASFYCFEVLHKTGT